MNQQLMEDGQMLAQDRAADCDRLIPVALEGMIEMKVKQRSEVKQ